MATPVRELSYGAIEIFTKETLGVGSYGKVCKAKCGQLPCAAKLLHDTMFDANDPGISKFVERFEQECHFLKAIKHPNIVQFLGTVRDHQSQRLTLLMELMDESLTRFLERSTGPLPYHTQLNICHDVALALAYLHFNDIIHRDLSSNNVLLIGEGSRAKVTDFGMSTLEGMNPRMTPLTMCPGMHVCMPPEALVNPPRYSNKLDCFSLGVLTIQIVSRQFPKPGDAHKYVEIPDYSSGKILIQLPEIKRRKNDIDLVDPNHPLLPLALHCLKDRDAERPSADELCGRLATLKDEQVYTRSVEQSREQSVSVQTLQQQIQERDGELARARADYQQKVREKEAELSRARADYQQKVREKEAELSRARASHETELRDSCATLEEQIQQKDDELARARANDQIEINDYQTKLEKKCDELNSRESEMAQCHAQLQSHESATEKLCNEIRELGQKLEQQKTLQATPHPQQETQKMRRIATWHVGNSIRMSVYVRTHRAHTEIRTRTLKSETCIDFLVADDPICGLDQILYSTNLTCANRTTDTSIARSMNHAFLI